MEVDGNPMTRVVAPAGAAFGYLWLPTPASEATHNGTGHLYICLRDRPLHYSVYSSSQPDRSPTVDKLDLLALAACAPQKNLPRISHLQTTQ